MVTLTPEQFDHAINTIAWLCIVMGMVGALVMQLLQTVFIGICTKVIYFIDRKHRIDMSRKRAERFRSIGQRFVGVADRMDLRHEAREHAKTAVVDDRPLICRGKFADHLWDADVHGDQVSYASCSRCGQDAYP